MILHWIQPEAGAALIRTFKFGSNIRGIRSKSRRPDYITVNAHEAEEAIRDRNKRDEYIDIILTPCLNIPTRASIYWSCE